MKSNLHTLLDPIVCSCFSNTHRSIVCHQLRWSTLSIGTALLIIIVYATSGLYTLIDVTTLMSIQSVAAKNESLFPAIEFSSTTIHLRWILFCVYLTVVLLVVLLISGIQFNQPWLLLVWSMLMVIMLLADGIVTVLSLRDHHHQIYPVSHQIHILYRVMIIRLLIVLCSILLAVYHFRRLNQAKSEYINRQRMLNRYNSESTSTSLNNSWTLSGGPLISSSDVTGELYISDLPTPISLPRANIATIQRRPTSTVFHSHQMIPSHIPMNDYTPERVNHELNHICPDDYLLNERFQEEL